MIHADGNTLDLARAERRGIDHASRRVKSKQAETALNHMEALSLLRMLVRAIIFTTALEHDHVVMIILRPTMETDTYGTPVSLGRYLLLLCQQSLVDAHWPFETEERHRLRALILAQSAHIRQEQRDGREFCLRHSNSNKNVQTDYPFRILFEFE